MPLQPRKQINDIMPGIHGGPDRAEIEKLGIDPDKVIDFSVSTSPTGVPPGVLRNITGKVLGEYPDSQATLLRREIAGKEGVSGNNVLVSSGSTEVIRLAVMAYLDKGDKALILEPTYGEYRLACEISGAEVITYRSREDDNFRPETDTVAAMIRSEKPKAVFVCNPNNPTGYYLGIREFEKILSVSEGSLIVLDEAYISFVGRAWLSTEYIEKANLLVVRSMTKDYSLAGLRLGYAIANEEIIGTLRKICPPWNVNAIAQRAGIAAFRHEGYMEKSRESSQRGKNYLVNELGKSGFRCLPSDANFFLVRVGNADEVRSGLLKKGILVRDCTSFGLSEYIRVAPRTPAQNRRLIKAIKELMNESRR